MELLLKVTFSRETARNIFALSFELLRDWHGRFDESQQGKNHEKKEAGKRKEEEENEKVVDILKK
jgi:hypothetical protein